MRGAGFGLGFGVSQLALAAGFSPASLFAASEPGGWYDPSDLTTLFQDSAGTTPVTAAGQSVGLVLDKSRGLVLGSELFANQTPTVSNAAGSVGAYNSGTRTMTNSGSLSAGYPRFQFNLGLVTGRTYVVTGVLDGSRTQVQRVRLAASGTANDIPYNNTTGVFSGYVIANGASLEFVTELDGVESLTIASISVRELPGNHLTQSSSGSRPQYNVDANGRGFLLFDGSDDFLISPTITPGTDKAQVFAGVRKLSDAALGALAETSTSPGAANPGWFTLSAPRTAATGDYSFNANGTATATGATTGNSYAAPITNVLAGTADLGGDSVTLRVNGVQQATSALDRGTGNFLAYPMYVGRRGGTSLPFNGRIYGLIVRFGANLDSAQIAAAETWMNQRTGAY